MSKKPRYDVGKEATPGYRPNGESAFTSRAAHGDYVRVDVDTPADLLRRLKRAKARHGNHRDPVVRRRAGEDMRELQFALRRLGYAV